MNSPLKLLHQSDICTTNINGEIINYSKETYIIALRYRRTLNNSQLMYIYKIPTHAISGVGLSHEEAYKNMIDSYNRCKALDQEFEHNTNNYDIF